VINDSEWSHLYSNLVLWSRLSVSHVEVPLLKLCATSCAHLLTTAKEVIFLPLSVCLSRITETVVDKLVWNFFGVGCVTRNKWLDFRWRSRLQHRPRNFSKELLLLQDGNSCANYADNSCEFSWGEENVSLSTNRSVLVHIVGLEYGKFLTEFLLVG